MSQSVTFFRNRQQDSGCTYQFDLDAPNRQYRVFVYSRETLPMAILRSRQLPRDSFVEEMNSLALDVQKDGKGGVIAATYVESGSLFMFAHPVPFGDMTPFAGLGLLLPGRPFQLEPLWQEFRSLSRGAHVLVPVDCEAEESLRGFHGFLGCLPRDLESLILHTIRKPSLEMRMERVEGKVFSREGDAGGERLGRLLHLKVTLAALLFLVLLNTGQLYLLLLLHQRIEALPNRSVVTAQEDGKEPAADHEIYVLLQAVRGKAGAIPAFKALDQAHFNPFKTERDVTEALRSQQETRLLLLGLMKLAALHSDKGAANALLGPSDNLTQMKEFFGQDGRLDDASITAAFAALSCVAYGAPGLPVTSTSPELPFSSGQNCAANPLSAAVPGIQKLASYVENETK